MDQAGNKAARDRPCEPGEQQVLTNVPSQPGKRSSAPPPGQRAAPPQPRKPGPDFSSILSGAAKGLFALIPLALFAGLGVIALALLRRRLLAVKRGRTGVRLPPADHWGPRDAAADSIPYEPSRRSEPVVSAVMPTAWSAKLIRDLEWKRFEELVRAYWRTKGYRAELTSAGADGGADVLLYSPKTNRLFAVAQCKSFRNEKVGVPLARELWGVVHHNRAELGLLYGLSGFTKEAVAFASGKHLKLVSAEDFLGQIWALPREQQAALLEEVCRGDYLTPTCPTCDTKMVLRESARGQFWGCKGFPKCDHTFHLNAHAGYR